MAETGSVVEAGMAYANAGSFLFKEKNTDGGVRLLQMAVKVFQDVGKLDKAGKYEKLIAEKLDGTGADEDRKAAQAHYERAYDLFSTDDTYKIHAIGCLEKIGEIVSCRHDFKGAMKWWEKLIDACAGDSRLNQRMTKAMMNAFYCAITQLDSVFTAEKLDSWSQRNVRFARSNGNTFCRDLNRAFEDRDYKALSTAFSKWDRYNKLEDWMVKCVKIVFDEIKPTTDDDAESASSAGTAVASAAVSAPAPPPDAAGVSSDDDEGDGDSSLL